MTLQSYRSWQSGFALIVALVFLLVMTMIAVIAMRSTSLDLKMTTNTTLNRRAFQASEGARAAIGSVLTSFFFNHGWTGFVPPAEVIVTDTTKTPDQYTSLADLPPPDGTGTRPADLKFRSNQDGTRSADSATIADLFSNIWITRTGKVKIEGSDSCQGCSASFYVMFDVRSQGAAPGNAQVRTGADFRAKN